MTRVDFYLLPDVDLEAKLRFACRLAYKAVGAGNHVHVRTGDEATSRSLDELMWVYPPDQFLPHACTDADDSQAPVQIGRDDPTSSEADMLINLGSDVPTFFGRFDRVAEIVLDPERDLGRERYRHYRDRGYPLQHHELNDWED